MSTKYIHFTEEQKTRARQTDIAELLRSQDETIKRSGSEYEWLAGTQRVTIRGNLWYHQYEQVGGDAIDFIRRFYGKNYPEAVEYLLAGSGGTIITSAPIIKTPGELELPPRNDNMRRVFAYLCSARCIDNEIVADFVHEKMIYESADHHNAVFVGYDGNGTPRHANMRGTFTGSTFKGNAPNSIPEYSFHRIGTSKYLFLFEAPIDMLSFISMHKYGWRQHSYAAACSISDRVLFQTMADNPNISEVFLCLDNDKYGQTANKRMQSKLMSQGIKTKILVPNHKDWNEDRLAAGGNAPRKSAEFSVSKENTEEGEELCLALQLS